MDAMPISDSNFASAAAASARWVLDLPTGAVIGSTTGRQFLRALKQRVALPGYYGAEDSGRWTPEAQQQLYRYARDVLALHADEIPLQPDDEAWTRAQLAFAVWVLERQRYPDLRRDAVDLPARTTLPPWDRAPPDDGTGATFVDPHHEAAHAATTAARTTAQTDPNGTRAFDLSASVQNATTSLASARTATLVTGAVLLLALAWDYSRGYRYARKRR